MKKLNNKDWEEGFIAGLRQARELLDMCINLEKRNKDPFDILANELCKQREQGENNGL